MLQESILQYVLPSLSYHLPFNTFILSILEWPLKTSFTVFHLMTVIFYIDVIVFIHVHFVIINIVLAYDGLC